MRSFIPNSNASLGPGTYDVTSPSKVFHHSVWNKSNRFVSFEIGNRSGNVGPGAYNFDKAIKTDKSAASSAFKSKVAKSFMQEA